MNFMRTILAVLVSIIGMSLALPVMVIGLPFWLIVLLVRTISRYIEPKFIPWQQLMEFDPNVGWKPKANLDTYYLAPNDDIYHIRTDSLGWPGQTHISDNKVVVFGDSFAFGHGINTDKSFANLNPRIPIKAIGANGYNLVQELILMKQMSPQLRGKLVVWFIYLENDLHDNLMPNMNSYTTPFLRKVNDELDWEIVTDHLSPDKWNFSSEWRPNLSIFAKLFTPCHLSQRVYAACSYLIREGSEICNNVDAKLIVMTIPNLRQLTHKGLEYLKSQDIDKSLFDPDYPDKIIGEICQKHGVEFLASQKYLTSKDYKEFEKFHWNEQGHRRVSKLLAGLYGSFTSGKQHVITKSNQVRSSATL